MPKRGQECVLKRDGKRSDHEILDESASSSFLARGIEKPFWCGPLLVSRATRERISRGNRHFRLTTSPSQTISMTSLGNERNMSRQKIGVCHRKTFPRCPNKALIVGLPGSPTPSSSGHRVARHALAVIVPPWPMPFRHFDDSTFTPETLASRKACKRNFFLIAKFGTKTYFACDGFYFR